MDCKKELDKIEKIGDIFSLVKKVGESYLGLEQAGLLVALGDLGMAGTSFIGAFYSPDANTIVINKRPLEKMKQAGPKLYKAYIFHILLHEYIHSLGFMDEAQVRLLTYNISKKFLGREHSVTKLASDLSAYMPSLSPSESIMPEDNSLDYVMGIDRDATDYIM